MEKKNLMEKLNQNKNQNLEEIISIERQKNLDSNKVIQQLQDELNKKLNNDGDNSNNLKQLQDENMDLKNQINMLKNENMILQSQRNLVGSNDSQTFPRSLNNTLLRQNQLV
jgi:cell division protein FtsB